MTFDRRVTALPGLGLGVSTEFGAFTAPGGLDLNALCYRNPRWASFLEVGVETAKGLDRDSTVWAEQGLATTYHFLDLNLDHPEDFDPAWIAEVRRIVARLHPAWMCGDAGLWHFGPRDRGHMLLLPPILCEETVEAMAAGVRALREATGLEVFPENPPGQVFAGDLHILDFFRELCLRADTGMLLDCAHLALYQRTMRRDPLEGLDRFPLDRVVEMHVAGGSELECEGYPYVEDDHGPGVLPETWEILEYLAPRTKNLRAVVFECERNPLRALERSFERIESALAGSALHGSPRVPA